MLQAIRSRIRSDSEMWLIAGGALFVALMVAGGFGLSGKVALGVGALAVVLMAIGAGQLLYEEFSTLAN